LRLKKGFLILIALAGMMIATSSCCGRTMAYLASSHHQKETLSSVRNLMTEFSVDAETKSGDYIKATNEGGLMFLKGRHLKVIPWNALYDTATKTWVVFLINVTSNSFSVIYLYLSNGTGAFKLQYYEYGAPSLELYLFYGADHVKNQTRSTPSMEMPRLSIVPEAKTPSGISALGPTLFINDKGGLYINWTEPLSLYPLLYSRFPNVSELWLLMTDLQGRYYYSIFYLFERDRDHILRAHTLRLNDLSKAPFENIEAQWSPGAFPCSLTVSSDVKNVTVKINGFPFRTNELGRIEIQVPMGDITVEAQSEVTTGRGSRKIFSEWKWFTKSNPTFVRIAQNTDLYLTYKTQFYLSLKSPYGSPMGEGWYDAGTAARFSIEPLIDLSNGTRLMFRGWTGDQESSNFEEVVMIDKPKTLRANWKRQYEILITTKGLPSGVAINITVNKNQTTVSVPFRHRQWVDAESALMINTSPTNLSVSQIRYVFRRWQTEAGETVVLPTTVKGPTQLTARYETEEPFTGKITMQVVPATLVVGDAVTIRGTTTPSRPSTNVTIFWSQDSTGWTEAATVTTDGSGNYAYVWQVHQREKIYFKARWTYDPDYDPIESSISTVTRIVTDRHTRWPEFLNSLVGLVENSPIPSQVITILLYPLIKASEAAMLLSATTGSPRWLQEVAVWVLTGMLVGPLYLGPVLTLLALAWKKVTHRSPSANWVVLFIVATAIGVGLALIGQVLSAPAILQLGLAVEMIAPSLLTSYLVALAVAKIR